MSQATYDEKRSFIYFLFLVIVTAFGFVLENMSDAALGVLAIIWGIYGFFRLVHLTPKGGDVPYILSLPAQLLFGLAKQQEERIARIIDRLLQPDVILWVYGALIFTGFALMCSLFPTENTIIKALQLQQETVLDLPISNSIDFYVIMRGLSFYGILGVIILSALSYSQSQTNIKWAFFVLLPVFVAGAALHFLLFPIASFVLLPDLSVMRGGGFGESVIMRLLVPDMMNNSGTGLVTRFTEFGMVGAYGTYILFLPAIIMMVKALFNSTKNYTKPIVGLWCFAVLLLLDFFWISSPMGSALLILGLALGALCWGACGSRQ